MKKEIIQSTRPVNANGIDYIVVTTVTGAIVWVRKASFDASAETISYTPMKAGDEYTKKDGTVATLAKDRNNFEGTGRQIVQKSSSLEILDYLLGKGVTPAFNLG